MTNPDPTKLASLLDLTESDCVWTEVELSAILAHQLSEVIGEQRTIREILLSSTAAVDQLQELKHWAKVRRGQQNTSVPQDIFRVIYFAAIASAQINGQRISELSPAELEQGWTWAAAQPWVDEQIKSLFARALAPGV